MKIIKSAPVINSSINNAIADVTSNHFGAISINSFGFDRFVSQSETLGMKGIRFPGGTVSETGYVIDGRIRLDGGEISPLTLIGDRSLFAFDLTHPELISPIALEFDDHNFPNRDDVATFSQALELAVSRDVSLGLIIPVQRYFNGVDFSSHKIRETSIEMAKSDIRHFIDRLKAGEYNDGRYPNKIIFEIGNEPYHNPIEYAVIAKAMIGEITLQMQNADIDFDIAFQIGRGSFEYNNLVESGYFNKFFSDTSDLIPGLENLNFKPGDDLKLSDRQIAIDKVMAAIIGESIEHIDMIRHHVLGFNVNLHDRVDAPLYARTDNVNFWFQQLSEYDVSRSDVQYYISAWSTGGVGAETAPSSLVAAASTLEIFSYFMHAGVDRAALWGLVGAFQLSENTPDTVVTDRLLDFLSPQAAIIQLMAENITNTSYLGKSIGSESTYVTYTFEDASSYTVFYVAGSLNGATLMLSSELGLFSEVQSIRVVNLDVLDGTKGGASQIIDRNLLVDNGHITLEFDQNHEVVMIKLIKDESQEYKIVEQIETFLNSSIGLLSAKSVIIGSNFSDIIVGNGGTEVLVGGSGNDILEAGPGRSGLFHDGLLPSNFYEVGVGGGSFLFGGAGNDVLLGSAGNDFLVGGDGDDHLFGGGGFDTFVFKGGNDRIYDFEGRVDTIILDAHLFGDAAPDAWLENNAIWTDDAVSFDFGEHGSLVVHGNHNIHDLLADIDIQVFDDLFMF